MNNKLKLLLLSLNAAIALTACVGNGSDGSTSGQNASSDKSLLQNINNPLVLAAQKRIASL